MDENRIEEAKSIIKSCTAERHRKPYQTPNRLMVLGGIDAVVQNSISTGNDGNGPSTGS